MSLIVLPSSIMDTENGLKVVLTLANFGAKSKTAIIEFICKSTIELANLPTKDLDNGISNLHKALANVTTPRDRV